MKERVKTILEEHGISMFLHVQVVKPRSTGQFELHIQRRKRVLKRQAKMDSRSMVITAPLKLSGVQMTSRKALRQVKSFRIVKKTLSGMSESLWQINQIPEESHRIFNAVGLDLQQRLRNLQFPLSP